jgi:transposase
MKWSDSTDVQWAKLHPLLPPQKLRTGRPAKDHQSIYLAMLTVAAILLWL